MRVSRSNIFLNTKLLNHQFTQKFKPVVEDKFNYISQKKQNPKTSCHERKFLFSIVCFFTYLLTFRWHFGAPILCNHFCWRTIFVFLLVCTIIAYLSTFNPQIWFMGEFSNVSAEFDNVSYFAFIKYLYFSVNLQS